MLAYTVRHDLFILLFGGDNGVEISIVTQSLESPWHFIRLGTGVSSKIKNNERPEAGKSRGKKELLNGPMGGRRERKGGGEGVGAGD